MKTFQRFVLLCVAGAVWCASAAFGQASVLFFTDLESGPNSGGESINGYAGAYVTLYGNFLGANQGSSTVTLNGANCLRVVSWGTAHHWYQKIVVQLGGSGSPGGACATGNFVVTVGGQASNGLPFTVRSGNIRFVKTAANGGSDSNAGTVASPWASIRKAKNTLAAGDIAYIGGGVSQTGTETFDGILNMDSSGTPGNPKAIVAYPGASPQPAIGSTGTAYGARIPQTGAVASHWVWAGLKWDHNGGSSAIFTEGGSTNWRVVGNYFRCDSFNDNKGCLQFQDIQNVWFLGNELTDIGQEPRTQKQAHSLYFCSDTRHVWAGYNWIHDNTTCNAIQFHCSDPCGGTMYDLHVFNNVIDGDNCAGINFAASVDPSSGTVEAYNNVIVRTGRLIPTDGDGKKSCVDHGSDDNPGGSGTVQFYNNTMADCYGSEWSFPNNPGAIANSGGGSKIINFRNNIFYIPDANERYVSITFGSNLRGDRNLWFGHGNGPTSGFTNNINADPLFLNYAGGDFRLQAASPAIGAGLAIPGLGADLAGIFRPQGTAFDLGAHEHHQGSPLPPPLPAPTLISVEPLL